MLFCVYEYIFPPCKIEGIVKNITVNKRGNKEKVENSDLRRW
jgi:hypothetical protein